VALHTSAGATVAAGLAGGGRRPVISVAGLTKRYGEIEAVRGIDFEVERGETFGFLGPNGAGKTTTIKILCTLANATSGTASVAGHDCARERDAVRRNIGLVFQDTYLTAEQNLRFHAELYGVPTAAVAPRMRQVMDMVGSGTARTAWSPTFIYPGVLAMSVLFTAIFSAASIVWDREFGFLREILVAPVSRASIVIGKCLGGATIATFQGIIFLILAGFADVPYNPVLIAILIGELLLLSFTLTAFGVMMAARIKQFQAFMALTQMLVSRFSSYPALFTR
jgi:ABC-type oligopeptide transport system ATPase subunit